MNRMNRREFVKRASLAGAALPYIARSGQAAPSERLRLGFIGCGGRAQQMLPMFHSFADVDIVAISDVIEPRMSRAADVVSKGDRPQTPERYVEYERILDRKDIDAVVIATTQHWHGLPHIHACQAGKHIFVEKPLSHTVEEGRQMVKASEKYSVVSIMGTQQRAGPHYQKRWN